MTVPIDAQTVFEPDALVYCGKRLDPDAVEAPDPIVEVVSPGTGRIDGVEKRNGYFRVPSVMRYLIVDPKKRMIVHRRRGADAMIETRIVSGGDLALTPPGPTLSLDDAFADP